MDKLNPELELRIKKLRSIWRKGYEKTIKESFGGELESLPEPLRKAVAKAQKLIVDDYVEKCTLAFLESEEALAPLRKEIAEREGRGLAK